MRGTLLVRLWRAPPSTSSPQGTGPKAQEYSTYLSLRMRPTMVSWTASQSSPREPNCFAPSCMLPHLVIGEAGSLFLKTMMKKYGGASLLGTWSSSRCPCLNKTWTTWAAPLLGVPKGSRESFQTERPLRRSTPPPPPPHTMCRALSENRSASMESCSAHLRCWGRWRSFCSSQQHQEQGGAS